MDSVGELFSGLADLTTDTSSGSDILSPLSWGVVGCAGITFSMAPGATNDSSFDSGTSFSSLEPVGKLRDSDGTVTDVYKKDAHPLIVPYSRVESKANKVYRSLHQSYKFRSKFPVILAEDSAVATAVRDLFRKTVKEDILITLKTLEGILKIGFERTGNHSEISKL